MAETDETAVPAGTQLSDCCQVLDAKLNNFIANQRREGYASADLPELVFDQFGDTLVNKPHLASIEDELIQEFHNPKKSASGRKCELDVKNSKYNGAKGTVTLLSPVINCNGIVIGIDKVGHFFQLGYTIYSRLNGSTSGVVFDHVADGAVKVFNNWLHSRTGKRYKDPRGHFAKAILTAKYPNAFKFTQKGYNQNSEMNSFGAANTGVYSQADICANNAGAQFYKDLEKSVPGQRFSFSKFVTKDWSETYNPSLYTQELAATVWPNILVMRNWKMTLYDQGKVKSQLVENCQFSGTGTRFKVSVGPAAKAMASGSFDLSTRRDSKVARQTGLVNGITLKGNIQFQGEMRQFLLNSITENKIEGTWGHGANSANGGACTIET